MVFIKNIIAWLLPLVVGLIFELILIWPQYFNLLVLLLILTIIILYAYLVDWRANWQKIFFTWLILLLVLGGVIFLSITSQGLWQQIIVSLIVLSVALFTRNVFLYFHQPKTYQPFAL